jgi:hypothetical protein
MPVVSSPLAFLLGHACAESDPVVAIAEVPLGFDVPPSCPPCQCGAPYVLVGPDPSKRIIVYHSHGDLQTMPVLLACCISKPQGGGRI